MEFIYKTTPMPRRPLTTSKIMLRLLAGLLVVYAYALYQAYTFGSEYLINGILLYYTRFRFGCQNSEGASLGIKNTSAG